MSKHLTLSTVVAAACLMAFPAGSQASDCLGLHRVGDGAVRLVDGTGRAVMRAGHEIVRAGDGVLRWMLCDKRRG